MISTQNAALTENARTAHTASCIRFHKVNACHYSKNMRVSRWEFVEDPQKAEYNAVCSLCFGRDKQKSYELQGGEGTEFSSNEESTDTEGDVPVGAKEKS